MKILEYVGLDTTRVKAQYEKVRRAIERDEFRQADVKKLANIRSAVAPKAPIRPSGCRTAGVAAS